MKKQVIGVVEVDSNSSDVSKGGCDTCRNESMLVLMVLVTFECKRSAIFKIDSNSGGGGKMSRTVLVAEMILAGQ